MTLKIASLNKRFGEKIIFDNFSYEFLDTGLYVISGESGVGKTTLLRMIAGLDKEYEGEITGGGFSSVSFAFQEYRLFPGLSALDNVLLASFSEYTEEDREKTVSLLSSLRFSSEDMNLLPNELSGGMAQRISLVRAIMKDSKILILDEPTKELDRELRLKVFDIIKEEAKRRLVLLVTHEKEILESNDVISLNILAKKN